MSIPSSYPQTFVTEHCRTPAPAGLGISPERVGYLTGQRAPIIAICHLSWDWVWQRPQQFLSRLARMHPLLFVETHRTQSEQGYVEVSRDLDNPGLRIAKIQLPTRRWEDGDFIDWERRRLLQTWLINKSQGEFENAILWFNDPMAFPAYAGHLGECSIVYDCMDELSQFRGAPPEIVERERGLVKAADLIFCGGQKMRAKRLPHNPQTHFFATGVDCDHFGRKGVDHSLGHGELAELKGSVLGYFGVIDERLDYDLLYKLAIANPEWNVVMIGPTAKIERQQLPQAKNLYWLGPRAYAELPVLTSGMDVCLMPFALNEATEFINPTKALEYMAAGKPVISTNLDEVRLNFGKVVFIAHDHDEFISYCRCQAERPCNRRIRLGMELARGNTWESIVNRIEMHLDEVVCKKRSGRELNKLGAVTKGDYV